LFYELLLLQISHHPTKNQITRETIMSNLQFLTLKDVEQKTTLKKTTIYQLIQQGLFPGSYLLSKRKVAWSLGDIEDWMTSRHQ
jgi:prophage regulatory protein